MVLHILLCLINITFLLYKKSIIAEKMRRTLLLIFCKPYVIISKTWTGIKADILATMGMDA
jgi:hypothetical protein